MTCQEFATTRCRSREIRDGELVETAKGCVREGRRRAHGHERPRFALSCRVLLQGQTCVSARGGANTSVRPYWRGVGDLQGNIICFPANPHVCTLLNRSCGVARRPDTMWVSQGAQLRVVESAWSSRPRRAQIAFVRTPSPIRCGTANGWAIRYRTSGSSCGSP